MRKFFTYQVSLLIILSIICSIFFGALLRQHYLGINQKKYKSIKKIAVFFSNLAGFFSNHEKIKMETLK